MKIESIFIFGILVLFVFFMIMLICKSKKQRTYEILDYNEMENIFFEKIKKGMLPYKLLNIYTPFDLMMIRSFFISENIPYYVEFEHFMKVYPFIHSTNYNNCNIYILDDDYNDAIYIINNYIKSKYINEHKIKDVFRGVFEYIIMGWIITSPYNYLGFDVNFKNTK